VAFFPLSCSEDAGASGAGGAEGPVFPEHAVKSSVIIIKPQTHIFLIAIISFSLFEFKNSLVDKIYLLNYYIIFE
jgi:hypothetical protein